FLRRGPFYGIKLGLVAGIIFGTSGILVCAARAQQPQPVSITVAPMTHVAPSSQTQFPIKVNSKDALPRDTFLRIRGLPVLVALSEGYATAPGAWSVPLNAVPSLRMIVPVGASETSNVEISLVNLQGTIFAKATTKLMVVPAAPSTPSHLGVQTAAITPRN